MGMHKILIVFLFPLIVMFFSAGDAQKTGELPVQVNVGVLLEETVQKLSIACLNQAISDFYSDHPTYGTRVTLQRRNSTIDVITAAAGALDLIQAVGVAAIIGPPTSTQADFVIRLGERAHVPIITFSASNPYLTSVPGPFFLRATQNDATQTRAISALMQAFNWREAVPIYVDNEFGQGILPPLADSLVQISARIPHRCPISPKASDDRIEAELLKLMIMSTRVYVVHMGRAQGERVFSIARRLGMMSEGYVWIVTDSIANVLQLMDQPVVESMQGVIGLRPFVNASKMLTDFENRFRQKNPTIVSPKMTVYDLWGYDTVIAMAMAVEKVGGKIMGEKNSRNSSADLDDLSVSVNGDLLIQELSRVRFQGLTGEFKFFNGDMPPATYQILNINGPDVRPIGFWNGEHGLSNDPVMTSSRYITSSRSLSTIIWPGDSKIIPKGWVLPIDGKRLQILVPVKGGEHEFVKVTRNKKTNAYVASGFSIDLFNEAINTLPYSLPYDYIPYAFPNGSARGTYDEMLLQVSLQNYDAAVGDITIIANRSNFVDFSMPYTSSGVSLVVRSSYGVTKNPKIFMLPFSNTLWIVFLSSFLFVAVVVSLFEHNINSYFSGRFSNPFWYSGMMIVSAHGDNIVSGYTQIVVVVWSIVTMILVQSYTASLASLLTAQRLQPITSDAVELVRSKNAVGYSGGSFMRGMLLELGFEESNLIPFNSLDHCHELFESGTVVAAFAETPYLKAFLSTHCKVYTTKPAFQTAGFGFVFPKGSPLTNDVSHGVLQVATSVYHTTLNDSFSWIERKWFGSEGNCSDDALVEHSQLQWESFKYLFIGGWVLSAFLILPRFTNGFGLKPFIRRFFRNLSSYLKTPRGARVASGTPNLDLDPRILPLRH